jgi:hypothetical protein
VVESYLSSVWCGGQHPGRGGGHAATRHVNRWILLHGLRPQRVVSHALRETSQKNTRQRHRRINVRNKNVLGGNSGVADLGLEVVDAEVVRVRLRDAQRRWYVVAPGVARRRERHRVHRRGRRHERHPRQVLVHAGEHHRRRRDAAAHPHHLFDLVRVSGGHWPVVVWLAWPGLEWRARQTD